MKIVDERASGSTKFKDVPFGGVFCCEKISDVYIKIFDTLYMSRLKPCGYGEVELVYDPVNAISLENASSKFFTDDTVVTPLPNSFLTLK